jgi:hypothetical protein
MTDDIFYFVIADFLISEATYNAVFYIDSIELTEN